MPDRDGFMTMDEVYLERDAWQARAKAAVMEVARLRRLCSAVGELERFDVDYDACEGMSRVPTALGDFVDADDLEALLKEKGK